MVADFGRLLVVTDGRGAEPTRRLCDLVLGAGASAVQVRNKSLGDGAMLSLLVDVVEMARSQSAVVFVDDRVDVAFGAGAHGVHLGADDIAPDVARRILGPDALIGVTCRNADDARDAVAGGADYLGVGPVYRTLSKPGLPDPIGEMAVAEIAEGAGVPVFAIGGVDLERARRLMSLGVHGVAVMSAICDAVDPAVAVKEFLRAVEEAQ